MGWNNNKSYPRIYADHHGSEKEQPRISRKNADSERINHGFTGMNTDRICHFQK
jgi:hypothetical protein